MIDVVVLCDSMPDHLKDVKLNAVSLLTGSGVSALTNDQKWGCALAVAYSLRSKRVVDALLQSSLVAGLITQSVVDDAHAAASLMAMNNVFYRFRHLIGKESYETRPARLRMSRIGAPASSKLDFEMMSLAVSAVNGCGACMVAHEKAVLEKGSSEESVHDVVRIAAVVSSIVCALETS